MIQKKLMIVAWALIIGKTFTQVYGVWFLHNNHSDILISEDHSLISMKSILKIRMITSTTGLQKNMIANVCSQRFSKYSFNCMSTQRAILTKCILIDLSIARPEYKASWSGNNYNWRCVSASECNYAFNCIRGGWMYGVPFKIFHTNPEVTMQQLTFDGLH